MIVSTSPTLPVRFFNDKLTVSNFCFRLNTMHVSNHEENKICHIFCYLDQHKVLFIGVFLYHYAIQTKSK